MARAASYVIACVLFISKVDVPRISAQEEATDSATKSETAEQLELKLLAGMWVLVDRYTGDGQRTIEPQVMEIQETGDAILHGQELHGFWTTTTGRRIKVNPETSPKEMDVVVDGEVSRVAYELRDETLVVCSGMRGTFPKKVGIDLFGNYWRYVRGLDKGRELLVQRLLQQLENEYEVNVWPREARAHGHWPHNERLNIKGDTFAFDKKDIATAYKFKLNPLLEENLGAGKIVRAAPDGPGKFEAAKKPFVPLHIDIEIDDVTYQGVYEIDSGRLRFSYFADKPTERPEKIDAEGAVWVTLKPTAAKLMVRAPGLRGPGARRARLPEG